VNRRLFTAIFVDETGVAALRQLPSDQPVLLLPTHRSYLDFLLVSWILFTFDLKVPLSSRTLSARTISARMLK